MANNIFKAKVKATSETLNVYKLNNGNYYDYDNMGKSNLPSATVANKKEFKSNELFLN